MASDLDLIIVGGGPAGMMAGLLFARAGCNVAGARKACRLLPRFPRRHGPSLDARAAATSSGCSTSSSSGRTTKCARSPRASPNAMITIADLEPFAGREPVRGHDAAMGFPRFPCARKRGIIRRSTLRMEARRSTCCSRSERVAGVRLTDGEEVRAPPDDRRRRPQLGRCATRRTCRWKDLGAPIDVLWFRLPKEKTPTNETGGTFGAGTLVVQIDRGDYWQCAYVVPKGAADEIEAKGIAAFRDRRGAAAAPDLAGVVETLQDWDQVKIAVGVAGPAGNVVAARLARHRRRRARHVAGRRGRHQPGRPGCGCRRQHPRRPAGRAGEDRRSAPANRCRTRRSFPTRVIQVAQKTVHDRVLTPLVLRKAVLAKVPLALRLFQRFPLLRRIPARLVGLGIRREHIRSPDAGLRR